MNKAKEFFSKNKKVVIPAAVVLLLLIIAAICFGARSCVRKEADKPNKTLLAQAENTNASAETDSATPDASQAAGETTSANGTQSGAATPATSVAGTTASGGNSSSAATPSGGGNSGNANTASHTHTWKAHTAQKWVSNIVTVVDQPEKTEKYSIYKMYWYNTGKWEETRDPQRFNEWYKSKNGGLYTLYNPYAKPEDNPLFIGYDKNGNPQYTNDHTIIGPYYDVTPAVTHEEDHGHYETYVDYYYCDCGARK